MDSVICAKVEIQIELVETTVVSQTVGGLSCGNHHEGPGAAWPHWALRGERKSFDRV
jgi:hypothetical protein